MFKAYKKSMSRLCAIIMIVGLGYMTLIFAKEIVSQQFNNYAIAQSTHNRDESAFAWEILMSSGIMQESLKDGDILISPSNDDAFERNPGDIYSKTGVRLGMMLPPASIWARDCLENIDCKIENLRETLNEIISTRYQRKDYFPRNLFTKGDWFTQQKISNSALSADYVYQNFAPIGEGIHLVITATLLEDPLIGVAVKSDSLRVLAIYAPYANTKRIVYLNDKCLTGIISQNTSISNFKGWQTIEWDVPTMKTDFIDIRKINWGFCPG